MKTVLKKSGGKNWWCMAEEEGSWVGIKGENFTFRDTHFEAWAESCGCEWKGRTEAPCRTQRKRPE